MGAAAVAVALAGLAPAEASARTKIKRPAYGLTGGDALVGFDATNPARARGARRVTGITPEENLVGIDFRPETGLLYALGATGNVYSLDPGQSAQATKVSSLRTADGGTVALSGSRFGIDFNPVVDRLRVVSNSGQNLRVNVDTGVTTVDQTLAYGPGDRNSGARFSAVGAAYTNNDNDSRLELPLTPIGRQPTGTKLFTVDSARDLLGLQDPPNDGTVATIGRLPRRSSSAIGFDIYSIQNSEGNVSGNVAYAALRRNGRAQLYKVSLRTGKARRVKGGGGSFRAVEDIAIRP
jgi:hypothetical protein